MRFLSNLYNKIKKTIGKTTQRIKQGIGKAIHSITTRNNPSKQISTQQRQAIDFMRESYEPPNKRLKYLHGFTYQPQYSTQARAVYVNEGNRTVYYVIRGTETIQDGVNDLDILTGSEDKNDRFKSDLKYYDYLGQKFRGYRMEVLGSSLGGAIANYIGRQRGASGWAYNAGFGFGSNTNTGNVKNFRASKDIVSLLGANKKMDNIDLGDIDFIQSHSIPTI